MATDPVKAEASSASIRPKRSKGIRIFSYPKIIFLYPSLLAALVCGFMMMLFPVTPPGTVGAVVKPPADYASARNAIGIFFFLVFAFNCVVMALDFPRFTVIAGVLLASTLGLFLLVLADWGFSVIKPFTYLFGRIHLEANAEFYFFFALILLFVFGIIWITRWLDYWEIHRNEILHHHGPLSDLERYPTLNLKFDKEIPDIFEYFMARAGRLVLSVPNEQRAIVLENVPGINRIEERLKGLMSELEVSIGPGGSSQ